MTHPSFAPLPATKSGFLLAEWTCPAGYPWDISVIRTSWQAGHRPPEHVASVVLSPRPVPRLDFRQLCKEYEAFSRSGGPPLLGTADARDRDWTQRPEWRVHPGWREVVDVSALWDGTRALLRDLDTDLTTSAASSRLVADLWRDAPWLFLLDATLQHRIAAAVGCPTLLDPEDLQLIATQAALGSARVRNWPPAKLNPLQAWTRHPMPSDTAYDMLMRCYHGQGPSIVAFLEGSNVVRREGMGSEGLPKRASERFGHLRRARCWPVLVPLLREHLPAVPQRVGREDEALLLWAQARAARCIWLLLGGHVGSLGFLGLAGVTTGQTGPPAGAEVSSVGFDEFVRRRVAVQPCKLRGYPELGRVGVGFALGLLDPAAAVPQAPSGGGRPTRIDVSTPETT